MIYNNECFEYWILSHFKKYDLSWWKKKYLDKIRKFLPNLSNSKFTWRKDFDWLDKERINTAIKNVKEVDNNSSWNVKDIDPYSDVYKIIEFLQQ